MLTSTDNINLIHLKLLDQFLQYHHLKVKDLKQVRELIAEGAFTVKLKVAFSSSRRIFQDCPSQGNQEINKVLVERKIVQDPLSVFPLGSSLWHFTKLLQIPISLIRIGKLRLLI